MICIRCGADPNVERHTMTCPVHGEIHRIGLDPETRRLEDLLATAMRRAWAAWVAAGCSFIPLTRKRPSEERA